MGFVKPERSAPTSYTVIKSGGAYMAEPSPRSGLPSYSGDAAATVIQSAINALPANGGEIYLRSEEYTLGAALALSNKSHIRIRGGQGTKLTLADGVNDSLFNITNSSFIEICNLWLEGNSANQSVGSGIYPVNSVAVTLRNIYIHDVKERGVYAYATGGNGTTLYLEEVYTNSSYKEGIRIEGWRGFTVKNCVTETILTDWWPSLRVYQSEEGTIINHWCEGSKHYPLAINDSDDVKVIGGHFLEALDAGIIIGGNSYRAVLIGVMVKNTIGGTSLLIETGSNDCLVMGGSFDKPISNNGTGNRFINVPDFVTENSGVSTGTGFQQTIPHGLDVTPNRVQLTDLEAGASPYQSAPPDATNIYVTATINQDFLWKAWLE